MSATESPTVVIDPGHGGSTRVGGSSPNNATGPNGLLEKDVTLDLGRRVSSALAGKARVIMTREGDDNRSLAERARVARDANADVFVSIHMNGFGDASVDGSEAWIAKHPSDGSRMLARSVLDRVVSVTQARDRGVQEEDFGVLIPVRHASRTAATLVEVAFLTNPGEAHRLESDAYRQSIAQAIADGIAGRLAANGGKATAGALTTTAQANAIATMNAFRAETGDAAFTPSRADVADRAIALIGDPKLVEQGSLNLCGPAAVHRIWIERDPEAFAAYLTALYNTGTGSFGSTEVSPGSDLRSQDYDGTAVPAMKAAGGVCPAADWVAMSSLRDVTNTFLDFEGMPSEDVAAMTLPSEVASWLRATGLYGSVSDEGNWFLTKGVEHAEGLTPGPGVDVVMLINAHVLTSSAVAGHEKSDEFILNAFPNHFVVLRSPVTEPAADEVEFDCWTWGADVHVRIPKSVFEANYYGGVIARTAPATTSESLAVGGPSRIDGLDCDSRNPIPAFGDLRADGVEFAIFKATEGTTYVDAGTSPDSVPNASFAERRRGARAENFIVGSYHYGRAVEPLAQAPTLYRTQADNLISTVGRLLPGDLPPSFDFEEKHQISDVGWRGAQWLAPIEAFLDRVETALGRVPMIYTSARIWRDEPYVRDDPAFARFGDYPLWIVDYMARPPVPKSQRFANRLTRDPALPATWSDWAIWQYSGDFTPSGAAEVPHILDLDKKMDMNVSNGGIHVLRGLAGIGRPAPHGDSVRFVAQADEDGTIWILSYLGFWLEANLSEQAQQPDTFHGPLAAGDVAACEVGDRQYVALRDRVDGHLYEIERGGGQFAVTDLTDSVVNAGGVTSPDYLLPASDPVYLVEGADRMLVYWGKSDHQYLLRNVGGAWQPAIDVTASSGIEPASGDAALYIADGNAHVVARAGSDGHLWDAWHDGTTWNTRDLTAESGAPAATYQPTVYKDANGSPRIVYRALRGHIHEIDAAQQDSDLSQAAGAPTCAGKPSAFVLDGVMHVVYRRPDGVVHEISGDGAGGFRHSELGCAERAAADPATSVGTDGGDAAAFVVFRDRDGRFQEAMLKGGSWTCAAVSPSSNPAPAELALGAETLDAPPTPVVTAADSALVRPDRVLPASSCGVARADDGSYRERAPEKVVIHVLDDDGGYAADIARWQAGGSCKPPHYVIRNDGEITQLVAEKYMAQHAGPGGNPTMIGIEHDGWDKEPSYFTEAMYVSSAALVRDICARNGIDVDRRHIIGHDEVPGTTHGDPGGYWDWDYYMALVRWDGVDASTKPSRFVIDATRLSGSMPSAAWHSVDRDSGQAEWRRLREETGPLFYSGYGPQYVRAAAAPDAPEDDFVEFRFVAPEAGSWNVSAWWPIVEGACTAATIEILAPTSSDPDQQQTMVVDQTARWLRTRATLALPLSPTWCPLPVLELHLNDEVRVRFLRRSDARGFVIADAVRFLKI
jgi:N-acetylmuramoyl-L-alanine amidase/GH25 family lysozyme M1 (1,4-beta-N-acetylmuramidase)